ncbi:MAG: hypothetical protein J7J99_02105, partial [Thermoprotei archaeon]|nr:hypothetical protein [Thermoprotei archaeon]
ENLRKKLAEIERKEESLASEINLQEARMYLGEITKEEFEEKTRGMRLELEKLRAFKNTVREFLGEYSDEINIILPKEEEEKTESEVALKPSDEVKPISEDEGEEVVIGNLEIGGGEEQKLDEK